MALILFGIKVFSSTTRFPRAPLQSAVAFRKSPNALRNMDEDLEKLSREQLLDEAKKLRSAIRKHRDASGHDLCWHHPQMWSLLPEGPTSALAVPEWPQFMRGCIKYRQSLDEQAPEMPRITQEFKG